VTLMRGLICTLTAHWPALVVGPCRCRWCGQMIDWNGRGTWSVVPQDRPRWRCRIGLHRFRSIPDDVRARAAKAGMIEPPDWYAGRDGPTRCWDCGLAPTKPRNEQSAGSTREQS
jgi:hypothetical protein